MSNEPRPSDPPPKRQKVGLSVKEKVAKAPPTPLPVTAVVGGIGDDWFNQDDVTNLLPMNLLVGPAGVGLPISPWNRVVYRICGTISFTYAVCPRDLGFGRWETIV